MSRFSRGSVLTTKSDIKIEKLKKNGAFVYGALTVAGFHALRVAVLLRVAGDGAHVGHGMALRVGVRRVRRVARHVRRARVVFWKGQNDGSGHLFLRFAQV